MKFLIILSELLCLHLISLCCQQIAPRRDEHYPPRYILEAMQPVHDLCVTEIGVTEEAIIKFSDEEIHEDEKLKCYMNCIFHAIGIVDDTGNVHFDLLRAIVPYDLREIVHNMLDKCLHPEGDTLCERAFWLHKCWKTIDPVHYFLI